MAPNTCFVSSFCGGALLSSTFTLAAATQAPTKNSSITMTAENVDVSRRNFLKAAAAMAAFLPSAAALAKAGDGPKISIFGSGVASSPFEYDIQKKGNPLYKPLNAEDIEFHKSIVEKTKVRVLDVKKSIDDKYWDDIRSLIRLEAYNMRHSMEALIANIQSESDAAQAQAAYDALKKDLENLDYAAVKKLQDKAYTARTAALKSLDTFSALVQ